MLITINQKLNKTPAKGDDASSADKTPARIISLKEAKSIRHIAKLADDFFKDVGFVGFDMKEFIAGMGQSPRPEPSGFLEDWEDLPKGHEELVRVELARKLSATNLFLHDEIRPYCGVEFTPKGTFQVGDNPARVAVGALLDMPDDGDDVPYSLRVYVHIFPEPGSILDRRDWVHIAANLLGMQERFFYTLIGLADQRIIIQTHVDDVTLAYAKEIVQGIANIKLPLTLFENNPFL